MRSFRIVEDPAFHRLMKTGRPQTCIPSSRTVARDVHVVFKRVKERIAKMLQVNFQAILSEITLTVSQEYDACLNFATDAWSSPNNRAFVAQTVHFEQNGIPTSFLLDIIEVAASHSGKTLANAFAKILEDFGISEKVFNFLPI